MDERRVGRPTKYDPKYAAIARKACETGMTDVELADLLEVTTRTLSRWKLEHEDFCLALKAGKAVADDRVERCLFQKAVGYRSQAVKVFMPAGAEEPVYAPYEEEHAPDTTAAIFWLKNRRPKEWRDRQEVTGADGGPIQTEEVSDPRALAAKLAFFLRAQMEGSGER